MRKSWYIPGAVARLGVDGLRRAWRSFYGEEPMTERTFRSHLAALEHACAIIRAPGDWLWTLGSPGHPERRPRFPQTFHLIESERSASWWATVGAGELDKHPRARTNPDVWRRRFGDWRERAAKDRAELFEGIAAAAEIGKVPEAAPAPAATQAERRRRTMTIIAGALRKRTRDPLELVAALDRAGIRLSGRAQFRVMREPVKLAGAAALLAIAIARGDKIRNVPGWLLRAYEHAGGQELFDAWKIVRGEPDARRWVTDPRREPPPGKRGPRNRLRLLPSET